MKVEFIPFRSGEYAINDYTFRPGTNEVPDHISSTEPYKALVEAGAVKELQEPNVSELNKSVKTTKRSKEDLE